MLKEKIQRINKNRKRGFIATAIGFLTLFYFISSLAKSAAANGILTNGIENLYSLPVLSLYWNLSIIFEIGTLRMALLAFACAAPLILGGYFLSQAKKEKLEIKDTQKSIKQGELEDELRRLNQSE